MIHFLPRWLPNIPLLLAALTFTGCTAVGSRYSVSKAPPPSSVTFAVQPFESENYAKLSVEDRGVRDFEKIYLPLRLVEALRGTSRVNGAYLSTAASPAVDFMVAGDILQSNGKDIELQLKMTRVDGAEVLLKKFSFEQLDGRVQLVDAKLSQFVKTIAADLTGKALSTTVSLPEARALAYAENQSLSLTNEIISNAQEAGTIERDELLDPLTNKMLLRTRAMTPSYVAWQGYSTPLLRDQNASERRKTIANATQVLSFAAGAASVAGSYNAVQSGNTAAMQSSQQLMGQATKTMISATATADVAQNQINQIQKTLGAYKQQFSLGEQRQITVRVFGKLMSLSGSQSEMLGQFKKGVREDLNVPGERTGA